MKKILLIFLCILLVFSILRASISVQPLSLREFVGRLSKINFDFPATVTAFKDFTTSIKTIGEPLVDWWYTEFYTPITSDTGFVEAILIVIGWIPEFIDSIFLLGGAILETLVTPVDKLVWFVLQLSGEMVTFVLDAVLIFAYMIGAPVP